MFKDFVRIRGEFQFERIRANSNLNPYKNKVANAKCLGVRRAQGEIVLATDASNVGRGGTLF